MTSQTATSNVINLQAARERFRPQEVGMENYHNRRIEDRLQSRERLFIQITGGMDQRLVGKTMSCKAVDISASGMKIQTPQNIPAGSRIDLWVDIPTRQGKFFLSSDVRWSTTAEDGHYQLGAMFRETATTDIDEWRQIYR